MYLFPVAIYAEFGRNMVPSNSVANSKAPISVKLIKVCTL